MTDRDELAEVISEIMPMGYGATIDLVADAILSRWRLVPVEPPRHWPTWDHAHTYCQLCGARWPCHPYLTEHPAEQPPEAVTVTCPGDEQPVRPVDEARVYRMRTTGDGTWLEPEDETQEWVATSSTTAGLLPPQTVTVSQIPRPGRYVFGVTVKGEEINE